MGDNIVAGKADVLQCIQNKLDTIVNVWCFGDKCGSIWGQKKLLALEAEVKVLLWTRKKEPHSDLDWASWLGLGIWQLGKGKHGNMETWKHGRRKRKGEQSLGSGEGKMETTENFNMTNRKMHALLLERQAGTEGMDEHLSHVSFSLLDECPFM